MASNPLRPFNSCLRDDCLKLLQGWSDLNNCERSKPRNHRRRLLQQWAIGIGVTVVLILAFWINADYEAARQARQDLRHIYAYADYQPQWRYYNPAFHAYLDQIFNAVYGWKPDPQRIYSKLLD